MNAVEYNASFDLAQSTSDQILTNNIGNDNDQSASGSLFIYNPSSTTFFRAAHGEADDAVDFVYDTGKDLAQSTAGHNLNSETGNQDSDKSLSGELRLFSPSSTVHVKHFMSFTNDIDMSNYCTTAYTGGYCNVTAAIDGVQFAMSSGNIDSGVIKLYGIS